MNEIKYEKVNSSNIDSVGYDKNSNYLFIKFIDGGIYQYINVPINIFLSLLKAPSVGKYFYKEIKDKYSYEKI